MTAINVAYGVLDEENLVNFFKESFELDYHKDQFIKPTADFVLSIYLTLIDNFNLNLELNHLPYLQKVVNVTYYIEELLNKCNIFDFKVSDILQPKRKRTQTFVSQLVGIFLDTVEFSNCLNNQLDDEHEVNEAIEVEKKKIERLNNEIFKKKRDCYKLKPELDKLNMRNDELREQMIASRTYSQELSAKGALLKKEKTQINANLSEKEYEKLNIFAEVEKLEEDLKLITGNTIEQVENNKRQSADLRKECLQIQEKCRELSANFKNLKKENLNEFRNEQDEINRNRLVLKENLVEKENFKEKNKACLTEIECLKQKSIELENDYIKKIEDKEQEIKNVELNMEPVLELERVLKRQLNKKSMLNQEDEDVLRFKEDTNKKKQEHDYYLELKEQISRKHNALNENCIDKLKKMI